MVNYRTVCLENKMGNNILIINIFPSVTDAPAYPVNLTNFLSNASAAVEIVTLGSDRKKNGGGQYTSTEWEYVHLGSCLDSIL